MAYHKVGKWRECVLRVEYRKYRKTEARGSLGVQFVGYTSRLWWDRVYDICKFRSARTGIKKEVISALRGRIFLLHRKIVQTSVLTWQVRERKKQRDGTGGKQLKLFRLLLTMASWQFDIRLIPEFSGAATDMPIMEWLEDLELTCELCKITNVARGLPLRLKGAVWKTYR